MSTARMCPPVSPTGSRGSCCSRRRGAWTSSTRVTARRGQRKGHSTTRANAPVRRAAGRGSGAGPVVGRKDNGQTLGTVGPVGGLGRGERIYAVRFIGNAGYVVTFRQVDPLYTLDLSNPTRPRVVGELKLLG